MSHTRPSLVLNVGSNKSKTNTALFPQTLFRELASLLASTDESQLTRMVQSRMLFPPLRRIKEGNSHSFLLSCCGAGRKGPSKQSLQYVCFSMEDPRTHVMYTEAARSGMHGRPTGMARSNKSPITLVSFFHCGTKVFVPPSLPSSPHAWKRRATVSIGYCDNCSFSAVLTVSSRSRITRTVSVNHFTFSLRCHHMRLELL